MSQTRKHLPPQMRIYHRGCKETLYAFPTTSVYGFVRFRNELRASDFGVSADTPHPLTEGTFNRGVMEPLRADLRESVNTVPSGGNEDLPPSHIPVSLSSEGSIPSFFTMPAAQPENDE